MKKFKLSQKELKVLEAVGKKSTEIAAAGLSRMFKKEIEVGVVYSSILDYKEVANIQGNATTNAAVVHLDAIGDVNGTMFTIFWPNEAQKIAEMFLKGKIGDVIIFGELAASSLKEFSNIFAGAYLAELSRLGNLTIMHSVPAFAVDMIQAVLDGTLIKLALKAENVLLIGTEFLVKDANGAARGYFLFMPDPDGAEKVLNLLSRQESGK